MKTAVEWFFEQIMYADVDIKVWREIYDQAKEMEKEQIINSFEIGYDNGACVQEGNAIYHGNNYYNKTFKSE
jgi:hypothetical protein